MTTSFTYGPEYFLVDFLMRNGGSVKFENLHNEEQAIATEMIEAGLLVLNGALVAIPA